METHEINLKDTVKNFFPIVKRLKYHTCRKRIVKIKSYISYSKFKSDVLWRKHEMVSMYPNNLQIRHLLMDVYNHLG